MIRKKFLLWMKDEPEKKQEIQAGFVSIGACDIPAHYNFKHSSNVYGRDKAENKSPVNMPDKTRNYR